MRAPSVPISNHVKQAEATMSISKWHPGKLIILWAWGGLFAALALTQFLGSKVETSPIAHLLEVLFTLLILLALSVVTWKWLGGRESN